MDEVKKFLEIVRKYLLALIVVPIVTVVVTFFLASNIPNSYISQSQIATGIVDETRQYQQQSLTNLGMLQNEQVNQEFNNLINMMKMKKMLDQVSYTLILHDLTSEKPFKKPSKEIRDLNKSARAHAIDVYKEMYSKRQALNLWDDDQNGIYRVLTSMGYDSESINNKLNIYRSASSDFITIQFESEDPILSAMIVNTLSSEFISYYATIVRTNKIKATNFLNTLLREKSDTLANRMAELRGYKIKNRVLNLDEQSKQLYTSIIEYEAKKQEAVQNTSSYAGALNEIDRKFSPNERKYIEATLSKVNQAIIGTKEELSAMYDMYYKSDFEEKYKISIDSLQSKLSSEINKSSDQYLTDPLATKESLIQQKLDLEVKLDISRYSINALEREINRLNDQFDQLVPREAEVQSYEMGIDIATKEYLDILNKYNQSSLESEIPIKLNVVQLGMPGLPQPSKKMLLIILSGIISGFVVLAVLFVIFLLDNRIISSEELSNKTQLPVLGIVNKIDVPSIDLKEIWRSDDAHPSAISVLKNQLRSIRYEIERDLSGRKVLVINSLSAQQGKTFLTMSLAFAWVMTGKKILVIDGDFNSSKISDHVSSEIYIEDFLQEDNLIDFSKGNSSLVVLKNKGGDASLMEIASSAVIKEKLDQAKEFFDLILIETSSMNFVSQSKEWISFADKVVSVFGFGCSINKKEKVFIEYLKNTGNFSGWIMNKITSGK